MEENKYRLYKVNLYHDIEEVTSIERGIDLICSTDESTVFFKTEYGTVIRLIIVLGNSPCETVFDYSIPIDEDEAEKLDKVMEEWSDSWEGRDCPTVEDMEKDQIIVEVRGGVAYCNDPRVEIIDHDNKDE
jgi:hypothetical protein